MTTWVRRLAWCLLVLSVAVGVLGAGEAKPKPKAQPQKPKPPAPAKHEVKPATFKIEVKLKGIFESAEMAELAVAPKAWGQLQVVKAAEQGARVKKGEQVLWLDVEKIDEAIRAAEQAQALTDLNVRLAEENLSILEKETPLSLAAADRADKRFQEDYKHFFEVELPYSKKSADFSLKSAGFYLMYAKEELKQLQKMYEEDDLTEETEEIILKRARFAVERAELSFERSQNSYEWNTKFELPRQEENARHNAKAQELSYAKAKTLLPLQLNQKRLELAKMKRDQHLASEKLAKLKNDRASMVVKAPIDGVIYYGQCVRGHWTTGAAVEGLLRPGGVIKPHQVVMTVVKPRPLRVRTVAPEKELHRLQPGLPAEVVPAGYPDLKLAAKLASVASVPFKEGSFDATLSLPAPKGAEALVAGMTCSIAVKAYEKKDAIAVPANLVYTDDKDPEKRYVLVLDKDGKQARRDVKAGKKNNGQIEILAGLKAGETIVAKKATEKK